LPAFFNGLNAIGSLAANFYFNLILSKRANYVTDVKVVIGNENAF
jgi:hypothetical protein